MIAGKPIREPVVQHGPFGERGGFCCTNESMLLQSLWLPVLVAEVLVGVDLWVVRHQQAWGRGAAMPGWQAGRPDGLGRHTGVAAQRDPHPP